MGLTEDQIARLEVHGGGDAEEPAQTLELWHIPDEVRQRLETWPHLYRLADAADHVTVEP